MRNVTVTCLALLFAACGAQSPVPSPNPDPSPSTKLDPSPPTKPDPSLSTNEDPLPPPVASDAAAQPELHRRWSTSGHSDDAQLDYAYPNSGDFAVTMVCGRGSGRARIRTYNVYIPVIELVSGSAEVVLPAKATDVEDWDDTVDTLTDADLTAPVFRNFRRTGELNLRQPDREASATTDSERAAIEAFFTACDPAPPR